MAVIQADFEVAEVGVVVRHDLVISVDPNTDTVVQTEVLQLDREDEQHAVVDGLVKLVRMVGNTYNFIKFIYGTFNIIIHSSLPRGRILRAGIILVLSSSMLVS